MSPPPSPAPEQSAPVDPRVARSRRRVLDAATELLVSGGPSDVTVDAVVARSGVAKTTIYRHFASAHDLMVAAIGSLIEPLPTPNTGSLRDDLLALFRSRLDLANDAKLRPLIVGLLSASARDPELNRLHDELEHERNLPVRTVVELARGRGEVRDDVDLDLAVALIEGPLFMHVFVRNQPLDDATLTALVDLAVRSLEPVPVAP